MQSNLRIQASFRSNLIKTHFKFVSQLKKEQLLLVESMEVIKNVKAAANSIPGFTSQIITEKLV